MTADDKRGQAEVRASTDIPIEIPDRPGLGVTIDEDFVGRYTVKT